MGDSSHRGPTLQDQPNASLRDVSETATATVKMEVRLVCLRMFGFIRGKSTTNKPRSRKVLEVRKRAGSLDVLAGNCHQLFTLHFMHPPLPSPKRQSLRDRCKKKKKKRWGNRSRVKGAGLVTRGGVCCLSSSRCSNIFFLVMMPNTILKHTPVTQQTAQNNNNNRQTQREHTAAVHNKHNKKYNSKLTKLNTQIQLKL